MVTRLLTVFVIVLLAITLFLSWGARGSAPQGEQVLLLLDHSGSMGQEVPGAQATKWSSVLSAVPQWFDDEGARVGAVGFGGSCAADGVAFPVGSNHASIRAGLAALVPSGATPLNAALRRAPSLFDSRHSPRRIVLLSDGIDTCDPHESTCDVARRLAREHGIRIDVASWATDQPTIEALRCLAAVSSGTFVVPAAYDQWAGALRFSDRLAAVPVGALGVAAILLGSVVLYRNLVHVAGYSARRASVVVGLMAMLSLVTLGTGLLFPDRGWPTAASFAVAAAIIVLAVKQAARVRRFARGRAALAVLIVLAGSVPALAQTGTPANGCARVQAPEDLSRHHIIALDVSGTARPMLPAMKSLILCYAEMYSAPRHEFTLIAFGIDETGGARELATFAVDAAGAAPILERLFAEMSLQAPRQTRTYFKPVAEIISRTLHRTRLLPTVLMLSDGISDGPADLAAGLLQSPDVTFETLATKGMYVAPGMKGWSVAVQGAEGVDLSGLFTNSIRKRDVAVATTRAIPMIDPCLLDPPLTVTSDAELMLRPSWLPWARTAAGELHVSLANACVERYRRFAVDLEIGNETVTLTPPRRELLGTAPKTFKWPVSVPGTVASGDAVVHVHLLEGNTRRSVYPQEPATIAVTVQSYSAARGLSVAVAMLAVLVVVSAGALGVHRWRKRRGRRPVFVRALGGPAVPLYENVAKSLGGAGADIVISGFPPRTLATVTWKGQSGHLSWSAASGVTLHGHGWEGTGGSHPLNLEMKLSEGDESYSTTILSAKGGDQPREIGRRDAQRARDYSLQSGGPVRRGSAARPLI